MRHRGASASRLIAFVTALLAMLLSGGVAGADPNCATPPTDLRVAWDAEQSAVVLNWLPPGDCSPDS